MIRVEEYKEPQHDSSSQKFHNPSKLYLPLSQHTGAPSKPCVKKGDQVSEGEVIAKASGAISAQLHAPKSGKVIDIANWYHPTLKKAPAIIIQCQDEEKEYSSCKDKDIELLTKEKILKTIADCGIVGMGGAAFPTHVKLDPPKKIDTLIINGCECEPYLACDYRLMIENMDKIFRGIRLIAKLINPKEIIFAIEENKSAAIKKVNLLINTKKFDLPRLEPRQTDLPPIRLVVLDTAYPQGGEKQLIQLITKKKVPPKGLPLDIGALVHNVATCFAIYEAVYLNKPLVERLVSFCGDALATPKNIWVKIGTTLQELIDKKILEFEKEPKKIICGGPMMGIALDGLDYPILKNAGGFLFLCDQVDDSEEKPCLRCSRCVDTCPMDLLPLEYVKRVKKEEYASLSEFNIADCIECGCCAYSCPAKIPIVHYIKIGKNYDLNGK